MNHHPAAPARTTLAGAADWRGFATKPLRAPACSPRRTWELSRLPVRRHWQSVVRLAGQSPGTPGHVLCDDADAAVTNAEHHAADGGRLERLVHALCLRGRHLEG